MINFNLSDEQNEIRELALKFARNEMIPKAQEYDENKKFPADVLQKAWELGLLNTSIPEDCGGQGFSSITSTMITESLAYGCMGMTTSMMANDLALLPIIIGGDKAQKERFVRPYTEKFKLASFCLTEPGNGSDAGGLKTQLKDCGDHFLLNGQKMWITNAGYADIFVVYATIDPQLKHKGITACIVEKGAVGMEIGKSEDKMGHRCSDTRGISFNNVKVPKENILGGVGKGWEIAMKTLDHSRPLVASCSLGGSQRAMELSAQYAQERHQFGVPIYKHQAIQMMLAEMAIKTEASRLLIQKAAWLLDQGLSNTQAASMAKAFASDSCMQITTDAVQVYGGYGYSKEYPVEKLMRDAKLIQIYEGTSQIQRIVIARELVAKCTK